MRGRKKKDRVVVRILDRATMRERSVDLGSFREAYRAPITFGRSDSCSVVLDDADIADEHAHVRAVSNHRYLFYLATGRSMTRGCAVRIDGRPFEIGRFVIVVDDAYRPVDPVPFGLPDDSLVLGDAVRFKPVLRPQSAATATLAVGIATDLKAWMDPQFVLRGVDSALVIEPQEVNTAFLPQWVQATFLLSLIESQRMVVRLAMVFVYWAPMRTGAEGHIVQLRCIESPAMAIVVTEDHGMQLSVG